MIGNNQASDLLTDAQLVVDFASRAGLLEHPDDALIEEVHDVMRQIRNKPEDGSDNLSNIYLGGLYVALSKSVKTISPYISLRELRDGYSPFNKQTIGQKVSIVTLLTLFLLSLFLTITLIQRFQNNLTQLNEINAVNKLEIDKQVNIVSQRILDGSLKKPASEALSSYWAAFENAKKATMLTNDIITYAEVQDKGTVYSLIKNLFPFVVMDGSLNSNPFAILNLPNKSVDQNTNPYANLGNYNTFPTEKSSPFTASVSCKNLQTDFINSDGVESAEKREAFTKCISNSLGLLTETRKQSLVMVARERTMEVYILAAWLLPLFAGTLGASVYLIYNYYFDKLRPLGSPVRVLIRFLLGGMAGVIIGWFSAPTRYPGNDIELIDSIKQFPFMFAFLAGFSSEYAFSLMTKFITTTGNQLINKTNSGLDVHKDINQPASKTKGL